MLLTQSRAEAQPTPTPQQISPNAIRAASLPLDLTYRSGAPANRLSSADTKPAALVIDTSSKEHSRDRLAVSMAAAANVEVLQVGVERTREALIECQRGDYPGGGQGVLSLPFARPSARTDHCWH